MATNEKTEQSIESSRKRWHWLFLCLVALAGMVAVAIQTRFGPGTGGDSTSYLMGADNLLVGNGFSRFSGGYEIRPITGFPPFYSVILAVIHATSVPLIAAARWLNVVLFGVNTLLVGWLVIKRSGSFWAASIAALLVIASEQLFFWHSWVMSEPLFITLMLVGLIALMSHIDSPRWYLPPLIGFLFALATLTRYAGVSLLAAAGIILILSDTETWRRRLIETGLILLVGGATIALWLLHNTASAGTAVNREIIFHGVDSELVRLYLAEISSWFVPHELPLPTALRALLALLLAGLIAGIFIRRSIQLDWVRLKPLRLESHGVSVGALPWFLLLFSGAYIGVLALNSLLLDASTSPSAVPRYLTPLHIALIIFSVSETGLLLQQAKKGRWLVLMGVYAGLLFLLYAANTVQLIRNPLPNLGYTGNRYRWPALAATLQELDPDQVILSNNPELVYILAGRPAYVRPIRFDHYREEFRQDFEQQVHLAKDRLSEGGVLVIFKPVEEIDELVIALTEVKMLAEFEQAEIYGQPGSLRSAGTLLE